jgi:hypothetical protein
LAGGEGVEDDRKSDLNGFAILEGVEMDGLGADDGIGRGLEWAEAAVALMEAGVEETPLAFAEGRGFALGSVGADVTAELVLHGFLLLVAT